jgi:hypothetical protein
MVFAEVRCASCPGHRADATDASSPSYRAISVAEFVPLAFDGEQEPVEGRVTTRTRRVSRHRRRTFLDTARPRAGAAERRNATFSCRRARSS